MPCTSIVQAIRWIYIQYIIAKFGPEDFCVCEFAAIMFYRFRAVGTQVSAQESPVLICQIVLMS